MTSRQVVGFGWCGPAEKGATKGDSCGPEDLHGIFSKEWDYCRGDFSRTTARIKLFFCRNVVVKTVRTFVA